MEMEWLGLAMDVMDVSLNWYTSRKEMGNAWNDANVAGATSLSEWWHIYNY